MRSLQLELLDGIAAGVRKGIGRALAIVVASAAAAGAQLPADAEKLMDQAIAMERAGQLEPAAEVWGRVIEILPDQASAFVRRGQVLFKLARIEASLADFNRAVALDPASEPYLWQRGIAQFYAGEFEACRRQFEVHRRVNPNDAENAAWHFLCVAREDGPAVARASLLPVGPDSRIPLRTIYELYRGRSTPAEVMSVAASAPADRRSSALFYGELYIGLYHFILDENDKAVEILQAASGRDFPHYMRDVARVHLALHGER
jgi:lipoprotein NlpI